MLATCLLQERLLSHAVREVATASGRHCGGRNRPGAQRRKSKKIIKNASNARRAAPGGWLQSRKQQEKGQKKQGQPCRHPGITVDGPRTGNASGWQSGVFFRCSRKVDFILFLFYYFILFFCAGSGHVRSRGRKPSRAAEFKMSGGN